jgi:hypothetical protein
MCFKQFKLSNLDFAHKAALYFLLGMFCFSDVYSQTTDVIYEDVILLKSLKRVRGNIVDSIPGVSVDIRLHNQVTTTVMRENIYRIIREPYQDTNDNRKKSKSTILYEDVILLSDAQVLRGIITDSIPGESVTIRLHNDSINNVSRDDIVKILRERRRNYPKAEVDDQNDKSGPANTKTGGPVGIIELGYGNGRDNDPNNSFRLNGIIAANMQGVASLGAGLGMRYASQDDALALPLFIDFRLSPLKGRTSPFIAFSMGSSIQTAEGADFFSGTMIHVQGGIELAKTGKSGIMLSIGYEEFDIHRIETAQSNIPFGVFSSERLRAHTIQTLTFNVAFKF